MISLVLLLSRDWLKRKLQSFAPPLRFNYQRENNFKGDMLLFFILFVRTLVDDTVLKGEMLLFFKLFVRTLVDNTVCTTSCICRLKLVMDNLPVLIELTLLK